MIYCLYNFYYDSEYYCNRFFINITKIIDEIITNYVENKDELPSSISDDEEDWNFV